MKKQLEDEEQSSKDASTNVNSSDKPSMSCVNSNKAELTAASMLTVPSQQWSVLPQYIAVDGHNSSVYVAKVLYHPLSTPLNEYFQRRTYAIPSTTALYTKFKEG